MINLRDAYSLILIIRVQVAVAATIPWDSYLIRNNVWGYPPDAVLGWTLFEIPVEEVFFFVIQTYNTSMLYFLLSKPSLHVLFLRAAEGDRKLQRVRWTAALLGAGAIIVIECFSWVDRRATYMKLIFVWAGPIIIMLWYVRTGTTRRKIIDLFQAACVSIVDQSALVKYDTANRRTDFVFVGCRHDCSERGNLGYQQRHET